MIRVLVLDDVVVQREGIAKVVQDTGEMTVVGMAETPEEALAIVEEQEVELALVDYMLANHRLGTEVGQEMRRIRPELKVIIYTRWKAMVLASEILWEKEAEEHFRLHGYVLTDNITVERLKEIYHDIWHTGRYIDWEVLNRHFDILRFEALTPREEECALLLAKGYSNPEIAQSMVLAQRTVEGTIGKLYQKFRIPGDPRNPARRVLLAEAIKMLYGPRRFGHRVSVLLIDDNQDELRRLRELLDRDLRFEVVGEATSGRQGVELAHRKRPDLALVDVQMDPLDGFQTTRRIVADQLGIRVILISGTKSRAYAEEARLVGAVAYLPKSQLKAETIYELAMQVGGEETSQAWF